MKDGRQFSVTCQHPRGSIHHPFDETDRMQKFRDCCAASLTREACDALRKDLVNLRKLNSLRTLALRLRFDAGGDHGERFSRPQPSAAEAAAL